MMTENLKQKLKHCSVGLFFAGMALTGSISIFAKSPADPNKVLRYVFPTAETGFDPAYVHDLYSAHVLTSIFETLYTYDYLARPAKLIPHVATAMPEVSADGLTYTIHIKKGIYFTADPAFKGKPRELTAYDYAYSFKRLLDPNLRSPNSWLLEDKIEGMNALVKAANKSGKFNYDQNVSGLQTPDKYTLVIRLVKPDYNFPLLLAHDPTGAVAREVIEKYKDKAGFVMGHPVGTGPYMLSKWIPASRIVLKANPEYRVFIWNFNASSPGDEAIVKRLKGKQMPQIGTIDIQVMEENQSRWLAFQRGEVDIIQLEGQLVSKAIKDGKLRPELAKEGVQLSRIVDPEISYIYWNLKDPVVGGMSKEKIALRRAIAMSRSIDQEIKLVRNSDAERLHFPVPPGVVGYDPQYRSSTPYSVKAANLLLDRYHYKKDASGWRTQPNGKPLVVEYKARNDSIGQQSAELWKKNFDSLHIRMVYKPMLFSDLLRSQKQCEGMFGSSAWIADYPDGDNFMQNFYGPNTHMTNWSCGSIPEFDELYRQSQQVKPGPERDALYRKMTRLLEVYMPVQMSYARYRNMLAQPRIIGYKKHPILHAEWMYFDIDTNMKSNH
ncbi:TPA: ABC transporter substrate-binding protein [Acinetobacter baumannii]|uniref:ABC transporter substrate-binding protein n=3 Tax=Acinetobacter baumannii TaxID=470 RepID=UPI0012969450|nr:ABC transporter substrate-binding protein [Acinetobacter baumannii]HDX6143730.1 ABC transporter substrate-binding protein [Acinetobacter baumannii]